MSHRGLITEMDSCQESFERGRPLARIKPRQLEELIGPAQDMQARIALELAKARKPEQARSPFG